MPYLKHIPTLKLYSVLLIEVNSFTLLNKNRKKILIILKINLSYSFAYKQIQQQCIKS